MEPFLFYCFFLYIQEVWHDKCDFHFSIKEFGKLPLGGVNGGVRIELERSPFPAFSCRIRRVFKFCNWLHSARLESAKLKNLMGMKRDERKENSSSVASLENFDGNRTHTNQRWRRQSAHGRLQQQQPPRSRFCFTSANMSWVSWKRRWPPPVLTHELFFLLFDFGRFWCCWCCRWAVKGRQYGAWPVHTRGFNHICAPGLFLCTAKWGSGPLSNSSFCPLPHWLFPFAFPYFFLGWLDIFIWPFWLSVCVEFDQGRWLDAVSTANKISAVACRQ